MAAQTTAAAGTTRPKLAPLGHAGRDYEWEEERMALDAGLARWLFSYTRPYARKRNTLLVIVILRSLQLPVLAWMIGTIISGPIAGNSLSGLAWWTLGFLAFALWTQVTFHFRYRLALELGEAVIHDMRSDIFRHLQRMPMSFFNNNKIGRIISRMTSDSEAIRAGVQDVLFTSLVGLGQIVAAAVLMAWYDWVLFTIVAAVVPVLWTVNLHFRTKLGKAHRDVQESFSRITASLAESVNGIQVTQGFVRQETNSLLFRDLVMDHSEFNMGAARTAGFFLPLLELNSQLFLAALLVVGGYRVLSPGVNMPVGDLIQFLFLANIFFGPIQALGDQYNQAMLSMAGADRLHRLLTTEPEWKDPPTAQPLAPLAGRVCFENLSFGYDPRRPVLHEITFCAEPGQSVALVGMTGSGKTSIISLIAKFYLPTSGRLTVDGRDIREISTDSLRSKLGIVLQNNFLFSGTILENIRVGRPHATDQDVFDAVARLDCMDMIAALPQGFHYEVGEGGCRLSLGQRQLVCFARAMLADPRILILDEATSSIDVFTEHSIQQALAKLLQGRTSFIVAHRLSTIRNADLVLVLDHGRIVERGSHCELVGQRGIYANLHKQFTQASAA